MQVVGRGVVYRNPLPGHRVINAFYPFILPLDEEELLCVLRVGGALYSPDGMLETFRSTDRGATWEREGPVLDRSRDARHIMYAEGCLTNLSDGALILRLMRWDMSDPDKLAFNAANGGLLALETCFLRSEDRGRTWHDPIVPDVRAHFAEGVEPVPYGGVIELPDGSWFQAFESWKTYDNDGPFELNSYGLFSRDGGKAWGDRVPIAVGTQQGRSYSHGQPVRLADGRILLSLWTQEPDLQSSHDLHLVTSTDSTAREWTEPRPTGIPGQTSCAADMGRGRLWIVYSHREGTDRPGIRVAESLDGGQTWALEAPLVVWDAYGKEALGVPRTSTYPSSHDAIAYGAPRIVRLDGRHALACFWCTQGGDTHCRWCKVAE